MSLTKSWYTIEEAASKYGLSPQKLQEWADLGLVRTESDTNGVIRLNVNDIEQELDMVPSV